MNKFFVPIAAGPDFVVFLLVGGGRLVGVGDGVACFPCECYCV